MMNFTLNSRDAAEFVKEVLQDLETDWLSITITSREKYEDCSVCIVTDTLSEGTVVKLGLIYLRLL